MTVMRGQCLCGSVKFSASGVQTHHHACHCRMCRRWASGAFLGAHAKDVVFEGTESLGRYTSSAWADRGFCRTCGSTLFYFLRPTQTYTLSVGAFDDADAFLLAEEIFIDRKPEGYAFAGDHPRLTEAETFAAYAPPGA